MNTTKLTKSSTKINMSTNKVKFRSIGVNTDDNSPFTNCTYCCQDLNQPKIFFVPYIPHIYNSCVQNNAAGILNAFCKCQHGKSSVEPPRENNIGDSAANDETQITCASNEQTENIAKVISKNNLAACNSFSNPNIESSNLPKKSQIPLQVCKKKTRSSNRMNVNHLPGTNVNQYTHKVLGRKLEKCEFNNNTVEPPTNPNTSNIDEILNNEQNGIYKFLVPPESASSDASSVNEENDFEDYSASENEEATEISDKRKNNAIELMTDAQRQSKIEEIIEMRKINKPSSRNQKPSAIMLVMKALHEQREINNNSQINKILKELGFADGPLKKENKNINSPFRKK